jgi:DNA polymerase-3 subunit beta
MLDTITAAQVAIPAAELFEALSRTVITVSTEETRYYLGGVYMCRKSRTADLELCATDGHRLTAYTVRDCSPVPAETLPGVILPRDGVRELLAAMRKARRHRLPWSVLVEVSAKLVRFTLPETEGAHDGTVLDMVPIDGTFPDYHRVIPQHHDSDGHATVDGKKFRDTLTVLAGMGRAAGNMSVKLTFKQKTLRFDWSTDNTVTASAHAEVPVSSFQGPKDGQEEVYIAGFNAAYLLDFAKSTDGAVKFRFTDPGSPHLIDDTADSAAVRVLMPCRM